MSIGFVFQFYNLIPNLTCSGECRDGASDLPESAGCRSSIKEVDVRSEWTIFRHSFPGESSREFLSQELWTKNPKLLLCDEPTGALDYNTGKAILKLLQEMCREKGMTVIVITHNSALAPMADRLIQDTKNGKVSSMKVNENPISIDEIEW